MLNILILIALPFLISAGYAGYVGAPWLPSRKSWIASLERIVQIPENGQVFDLGCGDGRVLFALSKTFPNAHYIGYEISLVPYIVGKLKGFFGGYKNVEIRFGNLFSQNYQEADVIFLFLLEETYEKFATQKGYELKDECQILAETWPIRGVQEINKHQSKGNVPIFEYRGAQINKLS